MSEVVMMVCEFSHQLALLVVGQDLGDIPVSRGDGLQCVCTGVWLWGADKQTKKEECVTLVHSDKFTYIVL